MLCQQQLAVISVVVYLLALRSWHGCWPVLRKALRLHCGMHGAEALVLALRRVSSLIVTLSQTGRALQRAEAAYLDQLVAGLRCHPDNTHALSNTLNK